MSDPTLARERALWAAGARHVAGVDEGGRGPLAGPVIAAAVILPDADGPWEGLRDSKRMTAAEREAAAVSIRARAVAWGVGGASVREIDRVNVLRASVREPASLPAVFAELRLARGGDIRLDEWVDRLERELARPEEAELRARRSVEHLALALQASLLVRHAPHAVADAFCASRLGDGGLAFGTLPPSVDSGPILERSAPAP